MNVVPITRMTSERFIEKSVWSVVGGGVKMDKGYTCCS